MTAAAGERPVSKPADAGLPCIVDAGLGNLRSVQKALEQVGLAARVEADPAVLRRASCLVFPGQGGFADAARALAGPLGDVLRERLAEGVPYLGLCLGLQVLFEESEEAPGARGLALLPGRVRRFGQELRAADGSRLKVPHMGWNRVEAAGDAPLAGLLDGRHFYFAHSYHVVPDDPAVTLATAVHGVRFVAAVARDNLVAVQFHPEKSQRAGLALLRGWVELVRGAGRADGVAAGA